MSLRDRLRIWRRELWGHWWATFTAFVALAANWDRFAGWFGYSDRFGLAKFIRRVDGETWFLLWFAFTIFVLFNRVYHLAVDRDGLKGRLEKDNSNQELSDLLSDKHEYGVHELLNKPPTTQPEFDVWLEKEAAFTQNVLQIMDQYHCTKQERRHVHTLGVIQMIPLNPNPAIAHQLSMLVTRLGRIADIAGKYGS